MGGGTFLALHDGNGTSRADATSGPPIPRLVGLQQDAAESALASVGVADTTIQVTTVESPFPTGLVLAQTPAVGTLLAGTVIQLVVSQYSSTATNTVPAGDTGQG